MLKQYQHWKEAPVDAIVLGLYHLQMFYQNEIQRGLSGLGTYTLSSEYSALLRPMDEAVYQSSYSPEEIVHNVKQRQTQGTVDDIDIEKGTVTLLSNDHSKDKDSGTTQFSRARYGAFT